MIAVTTYQQTLSMKDARVDLLIETGPFDPRGHRNKIGPTGSVEIDGLLARGTDSIPTGAKNCVRRFEVRWNGRRVPIPDRQWKHLLNVSPRKSEYHDDERGTVYLLPADDHKAVLIALAGGLDGAGIFKIWWTVRETGVVGVFTEGPP